MVLRLASDCSISAKSDRSLDFESFNDFLKQFHSKFHRSPRFLPYIDIILVSATSTDDRSTLSDDDEGISSDDLDNEDISRKAIHRALIVNTPPSIFKSMK